MGRTALCSVPHLQEGATAVNKSESESATGGRTFPASCRVASYHRLDPLGEDGIMRCQRYSTDLRAPGDAMTRGLSGFRVTTVLTPGWLSEWAPRPSQDRA